MPNTLELDVIEVISGDTLRARHASGGKATIRVYGVDVPGEDHPCAPLATELARRVTGEERIAVEVMGRDSRGRIIGRIWAGGECLGEALVRNGLARYDRTWAPEARSLQTYEQEARSAGRGIWSPDAPAAGSLGSPSFATRWARRVEPFLPRALTNPGFALGGSALLVASVLAFVLSPFVGLLFAGFAGLSLYLFWRGDLFWRGGR